MIDNNRSNEKALYNLLIKVTNTRILVIKTDSTSIEYSILAMPAGRRLCKGCFSLLESASEAKITHRIFDLDDRERIVFDEEPLKRNMSHSEAIKGLLNIPGVRHDYSEIKAIGHIIQHPGRCFKKTVRIDSDVTRSIEKGSSSATVKSIMALSELLPDTVQMAVFKTNFPKKEPADVIAAQKIFKNREG